MMKRILFLLLVLPLTSAAELEIVCRPTTLTPQMDTDFGVMIYVKNKGDESALVPWGQPDEEGRIRPLFSSVLKLICFDHNEFKVSGKMHSAPIGRSFGGFACSFKNLPDGTRESKCTQLPAPRKLATYIEPGETLVYYYRIQLSSEMIPDTPDMCILTLEFDSLDISIPPITLMPKNSNPNQALEPTPDGAAHR